MYIHTPCTHSVLQDSGGELDLDQSSEILTFHAAIDNLVDSEEQLVTEHKAIIQADQYLLEEEKQLLLYVDDVNHDIEQYVTHMERIVSQKVERLSKFKGELRLLGFSTLRLFVSFLAWLNCFSWASWLPAFFIPFCVVLAVDVVVFFFSGQVQYNLPIKDTLGPAIFERLSSSQRLK